jgi:hypothetical protein
VEVAWIRSEGRDAYWRGQPLGVSYQFNTRTGPNSIPLR